MLGFLVADERKSGVQGGRHYRFELKTDLEATLDILKEDDQIEYIVNDLIEIGSMRGVI